MIPDIAGDDYGISFLDAVKSYIDIFGDDPDSGRVDENLVAFAVFDDFGVSGDDRDTRLSRPLFAWFVRSVSMSLWVSLLLI